MTGDLPATEVPPSVFPALEALLPRVAKPVQYVGGELNAQVRSWEAAAVRWALLYPDAYEVGLPNQGVQILYEILNERPDALAERCYAVWPDLEALMREAHVPAFTVDAHRPIGAFDLLGVSFSTELGYTNLLTTLDLAGIPLHAVDRSVDHPVVVAGGHAAFNPEPIADFVDVAALGDGEEVVGDITDVVAAWKAAGPARRTARAAVAAGATPRAATSRRSTPCPTPPTARSPRSYPPTRACRGPCRSARRSTSTPGRTRRRRWCRWPRPCTSGPASRSSAAAPAAAASARPG